MKNELILLALIMFCNACNNNNQIPDNVQIILNKAGQNRVELEKVIQHFQNPQDSLKLKAAYFLIGNIDQQSYMHFQVVDSNNTNMNFDVLNYPNYDKMISAWDSLESIYGKIKNSPDTVIYDYNLVTAEYLINNIELAFKVWEGFPWAKHINFDEFCEYILPYRSTNEPLENWRSFFYDKYQWVLDSVKNKDNPLEAAILINNDIKSWFTFDSRFYRQSTDQGLNEMLENKMGRCEDMTNLAIYAMRSMGIPVMSDFTPYWAKTGNNHAWNAIVDSNKKIIIFMGGLTNPIEYKLGQDLAKVYRKTFAIQSNSLAVIKPECERAPPYLDRNNIIDVTSDYIPVVDVVLTLEQKVPDSTNFAYICVFNTGEWKAIHWSKIEKGNKVIFTDMGLDIAYLPAFYLNEKIVPAGLPFVLTKTGESVPLRADRKKIITINPVSTTQKITKNATDNIELNFFETGLTYELFYWDGKWKSIGKKTSGKESLNFNNVPSRTLYRLVAENSKDEERIFTIDENGKQVWW